MTRDDLYRRLLAQVAEFCEAMLVDSENAFNDAYTQAAKLGPVEEVNLHLVGWQQGGELRMGLMAVLSSVRGGVTHGDN